MLTRDQTYSVRRVLQSRRRSSLSSSVRRVPHHAGWPACSLQAGDSSHSRRFKWDSNLSKPSCVSPPSRNLFTSFFQTTLGVKHRLTDLFRRTLDDLRVKSSFRVHPFPRHLHPCADHHYAASLPLCSSTWALLQATKCQRVQTPPLSPPTHPTGTGGAGLEGELRSPNLWPSLLDTC